MFPGAMALRASGVNGYKTAVSEVEREREWVKRTCENERQCKKEAGEKEKESPARFVLWKALPHDVRLLTCRDKDRRQTEHCAFFFVTGKVCYIVTIHALERKLCMRFRKREPYLAPWNGYTRVCIACELFLSEISKLIQKLLLFVY